MGQLLGATLLLGVAGLDPTAAVLTVAILLAGASRTGIMVFGSTVMIGAPLLGSVLSLTVASRLVGVDWGPV